jgi:hypothetical protein
MPDGTTLPPTSGPTGDACEARAPTLAEQQAEALGELTRIGLKIARAIERQVDAAGEGPEGLAQLNTAAIAFARVSRAVRQTVMLQTRLEDARTAAAARAGDLRGRVVRIVRRAIEDQFGEDQFGEDEFGEDGQGDAEQVERLCAEAAEGLEQERYGDVLTRPVGEIVADICKDLGLDPDWRGLAGEIAAAEAFARGDAKGAAPEADDGPIEVCWIGDDGRPEPVATMFPKRRAGSYDPSRDPAPRRDSS